MSTPVQLELFLTRNRQHRVCVSSFQLLIEPKGVCSHPAVGKAVNRSNATEQVDGLLTLPPVQLELILTRNRQHRVCVSSFQLLIEQKGVCSHSAVGKAVDRSNATERIDGC